jgi:hypothetical protein
VPRGCQEGGGVWDLRKEWEREKHARLGKGEEASIDEWQSGFWWECTPHAMEREAGPGPRVGKKVGRQCAQPVPGLCRSRPVKSHAIPVLPARPPTCHLGSSSYEKSLPEQALTPDAAASRPARARGRWGSSHAAPGDKTAGQGRLCEMGAAAHSNPRPARRLDWRSRRVSGCRRAHSSLTAFG